MIAEQTKKKRIKQTSKQGKNKQTTEIGYAISKGVYVYIYKNR